MFANHPTIAKEWAAKYGGGGKNLPYHKGEMEGKGKAQMNVKPSGTPSNESWQPQTTKIPRIPGLKRDYGMLTPSSSRRFIPRDKHTPNEEESTRARGVEHMHGSRHHKHSIAKMQVSALLGRDMGTAFNKEAKKVHTGRS